MSIEKATLYVIATPIGNLKDMAPRALEVLEAVNCIAAEDTRHTGGLLRYFGIHTPMVALHEHNERQAIGQLVERLKNGESIAQVSDAGTPLVSDPGFHLVRAAQDAGIRVVPIPGPSAVLAALAAAGLPTDRFMFEGFLPSKEGARVRHLQGLVRETRTLVFFEAPHRLVDSLRSMLEVFGGEREAVLARELTKTFETIRRTSVAELLDWVTEDPDQQRGEIVLLVHGAPQAASEEEEAEGFRVVEILAEELPLKQAAQLAFRITGVKKNRLYQHVTQSTGLD